MDDEIDVLAEQLLLMLGREDADHAELMELGDPVAIGDGRNRANLEFDMRMQCLN